MALTSTEPGGGEVSGNVKVATQHNTCCCWRSLNMCLTVAVVQATQFCDRNPMLVSVCH